MRCLLDTCWVRALRATVCAIALVTTMTSPAQTGEQEQQSKSDVVPVPVEVFQAARIRKMPDASVYYPIDERKNRNDGWVQLSFMVDPVGKPYEMVVTQSSGDYKGFNQAALSFVRDCKFEPALLNGQPIDSATGIKIIFTLDHSRGANPEFVKTYRALDKAIADANKPVADDSMAKLRANNPYEDAFLGLAQYRYAHSWGDEMQQVAGLRRAIAEERVAQYLPTDTFAIALENLLQLDLKMHDFADAVDTWEKLQNAGVDKKTLATLKPILDKVANIGTDDRAYGVTGTIVDGSWHFHLFKNRFQVAVSEGHISQIKLRCEKKFVTFPFDPELVYRVPKSFGKCAMELVGDPETKFELLQS